MEEYDQAAWHAIDVAFGPNPNPSNDEQLYVALQQNARWAVYFGRLNDAKTAFVPAVVALEGADPATYSAGPVTSATAIPPQLSAYAIGIDAARTLFGQVDRPYDASLYPLADGTFFVYLYPTQTKPNIFPIGGDERFHFSADGKTLIERHRMHRSVLDVPQPTGNGTQVPSDLHTDLFSDVPEDTDVFHVLAQFASPVASYVDARNVVYEINTSGEITCLGTLKNRS
jgi:hypothetical protein